MRADLGAHRILRESLYTVPACILFCGACLKLYLKPVAGLVVQSVLEKRLEAAESVIELSRAKEVWAGVVFSVVAYSLTSWVMLPELSLNSRALSSGVKF